MTFTKQQLLKAAKASMRYYRDASKPLWVVEVLHPHAHRLFKTRAQARAFAKRQDGPAYVSKAEWGGR